MIKHVLYWLLSISRATFKNFDWQGSNLIGYASWFFSDFPCIFLTQELSVWSRAAGTRCEALLQVVKSKKSICIWQPDLNFLPNPLLQIVHNFLSFEKFQEMALSITLLIWLTYYKPFKWLNFWLSYISPQILFTVF